MSHIVDYADVIDAQRFCVCVRRIEKSFDSSWGYNSIASSLYFVRNTQLTFITQWHFQPLLQAAERLIIGRGAP
jgi:hypothetical protein